MNFLILPIIIQLLPTFPVPIEGTPFVRQASYGYWPSTESVKATEDFARLLVKKGLGEKIHSYSLPNHIILRHK
jgi:hypothetical protein